MSWVEFIMVRSNGHSIETLVSNLAALVDDVAKNEENATIRIFRREKLDADICIVLLHAGEKTNAGGSPLALHLVAAMKEFASVHHTIWSEFVP